MKRSAGLMALALGFFLAWPRAAAADDASSNNPDASAAPDQSQNNYYWQGTQLYNLGRLGEAFDSFEKAKEHHQNEKEAEAYLLQIRQEIVTSAKKRADERASINFAGNSPDNALNIVYLDKDYLRVTLQAKFLFDENTADLKEGSVAVLQQLSSLLQQKQEDHVDLIMLDDVDATPEAKDIDAQRALLVFSYLNFNNSSPSVGAAG
jgi:outer membrane protein assembly factor BamD (BamD/ComL family)